MAGLGVVALHRLLNAAVPLESRQGTPGEGIVPALLALVLFTVIIGMDQIFGTAADQKRREVFDQATRQAPSIIFLDEIDAIAPMRGRIISAR